MITLLKSKIHKIEVTEARLEYNGSITIPSLKMEKANIQEYEQVHVHNATNGARIITYAIAGEEGQEGVFINGAASHLFKKGDIVHILCYRQVIENESLKEPIII